MTPRKSSQYGKGEHTIELEGDYLLDSTGLTEVFRSPDYQPPVLPDSAIELMELSRSKDVDYARILSVLERDPLIAAKVLRIAQSPLYTTRAPVVSLKEALVRLGLSTLTEIFMEVTLNMKVFRAKGYEEPVNRLRRHSTAVAYIARGVAHATGQSIELAFMCGLLHDLGMFAALITFAQPPRGARTPAFEKIWPVVVECEGEAAVVIANSWKLPPEVRTVLSNRRHLSVEGEPNPMIAAVLLAESIATALGEGSEPHVNQSTVDQARALLNIDDSVMSELNEYATRVIERLE